MARFHSSLFCLLVAACSHNPPPQTESSATKELSAPQGKRGERFLPADATFSDLVQTVSLVDGTETTTEPCLMGKNANGGYRLAGEVAPGLRPLPPPAEDLDAALKDASHVQVLSPWGAYGSAPAALSFASLTAFPPLRNALVLVLTDRGMTLRGTGTAGSVQSELAPQAKDLASLGSLDGIVAFVSAEAQVPLSQVYDLLKELTRLGARTALAVNLAPGTPLPALPAPNATLRCPDGLPETDLPEGDLSLDALLSSVQPLRERAPDCLLRGGASGAAGGKLTLALRIDAQGKVQESCVRADELGDAAIAGCVLDLARKLAFPKPQPEGGVVDAELPLVLRPHSAPAQAPVCSDTDL